MDKEYTTIKVHKDTRKDLMLFKIHLNAKNLDAVIKIVIEKLKKELNGSKTPDVLHNQKNGI